MVGSANLISVYIDPKYEEEVSGCTASVALISKTTIYVVSTIFDLLLRDCLLINSRAMLVTHVLSLGSKAEPNLYRTTISLRTRVRVVALCLKAVTYCLIRRESSDMCCRRFR